MACGTGKTRVMRKLAEKVKGKVLVVVPSHLLLEQFAKEFPSFCRVGMGYNDKIDFSAKGYIAVSNSVHLLSNMSFQEVYIDEAHHPIPARMPKSIETYYFSATHKADPDFEYSLADAVTDGVLCDYDIYVPTVFLTSVLQNLADMLRKRAGHFRRVLAYCNTVKEALRFKRVCEEHGLRAWHMNGTTPPKDRAQILKEFSGPLQLPVHVLVTVQVLGEGVNIPNADTCLFVEPRNSFVSIAQAIGRVLRKHPTKPLSHIIFPSVAMPPIQEPIGTYQSKSPSSRSFVFDSEGADSLESTSQRNADVKSEHTQQQNPNSAYVSMDATVQSRPADDEAFTTERNACIESKNAQKQNLYSAYVSMDATVQPRPADDEESTTERNAHIESENAQQRNLNSAYVQLRPADDEDPDAWQLESASPTGDVEVAAGHQVRNKVSHDDPTNHVASTFVASQNDVVIQTIPNDFKMEVQDIALEFGEDIVVEATTNFDFESTSPSRFERTNMHSSSVSSTHRDIVVIQEEQGLTVSPPVSEGSVIDLLTSSSIGHKPAQQKITVAEADQLTELNFHTGTKNTHFDGVTEGVETRATTFATSTQTEHVGVVVCCGEELKKAHQLVYDREPHVQEADGGHVTFKSDPHLFTDNYDALFDIDQDLQDASRGDKDTKTVGSQTAGNRAPYGSQVQWFESADTRQLKRFLLAFSQADSRLQSSLQEGDFSRFQFVDATAPSNARSLSFSRFLQSTIASTFAVASSWNMRLADVCMFLNDTQCLPSSASDVPFEQSLYFWIFHQKVKLRKGLLSRQELDAFNNAHPMLRNFLSHGLLDPEAVLKKNCQSLSMFVKQYQRLPAEKHPIGARSHKEEIRLASWISRLRLKVFTLRPDQIQILRDVHPLLSRKLERWLSSKSIWDRRLSDFSLFVQEFRRIPRRHAETEHEQSMHIWFAHQQSRFSCLSQKQVQSLCESSPIVDQRIKRWQDRARLQATCKGKECNQAEATQQTNNRRDATTEGN